MSDKQNTNDAANSLSDLINDNKKYIESGCGWGNPENDQVAAAKHRIRGLILVFEIFLKELVNGNTALRTQLAEARKDDCTWADYGDDSMPGTYEGSCGIVWTFTEGGIADNDCIYCPRCGGKIIDRALIDKEQEGGKG